MFILIDKDNLVQDAATYQDSLSEGNLQNMDLTLIELEKDQVVFMGDEYDPVTKGIIRRPENHPKPTNAELAERQIQGAMRRAAVASLKSKGILPADYIDPIEIPEEVIAGDLQK